MNAHTLRTTVLSVSLVVLGALGAPAVSADPIDVDIVTTPVCLVDTTSGEGCDVPADAPGVEVRVDGQCIGVLADCRP